MLKLNTLCFGYFRFVERYAVAFSFLDVSRWTQYVFVSTKHRTSHWNTTLDNLFLPEHEDSNNNNTSTLRCAESSSYLQVSLTSSVFCTEPWIRNTLHFVQLSGTSTLTQHNHRCHLTGNELRDDAKHVCVMWACASGQFAIIQCLFCSPNKSAKTSARSESCTTVFVTSVNNENYTESINQIFRCEENALQERLSSMNKNRNNTVNRKYSQKQQVAGFVPLWEEK